MKKELTVTVTMNGQGYATISAPDTEALFRRCQEEFKHCLGKIYDGEEQVGWRFARCTGETRCEHTDTFEVYFDWKS